MNVNIIRCSSPEPCILSDAIFALSNANPNLKAALILLHSNLVLLPSTLDSTLDRTPLGGSRPSNFHVSCNFFSFLFGTYFHLVTPPPIKKS